MQRGGSIVPTKSGRWRSWVTRTQYIAATRRWVDRRCIYTVTRITGCWTEAKLHEEEGTTSHVRNKQPMRHITCDAGRHVPIRAHVCRCVVENRCRLRVSTNHPSHSISMSNLYMVSHCCLREEGFCSTCLVRCSVVVWLPTSDMVLSLA